MTYEDVIGQSTTDADREASRVIRRFPGLTTQWHAEVWFGSSFLDAHNACPIMFLIFQENVAVRRSRGRPRKYP
ncbi:unnamed protein product [Strongylus vulgaris]|uniref:Uncharacterized protein n=1 Tax=Strongylus vulgaris TaxID=40348 RepID=A0A3P7I0W8_STRVU|nr:unnamed protein product [Strongylus vulgaris]